MSAPDTRTQARTLGGSTGLTDRWASHPCPDGPRGVGRAWGVAGRAGVRAERRRRPRPPGGGDRAGRQRAARRRPSPPQAVGLWGLGSPEATADLLARVVGSGVPGSESSARACRAGRSPPCGIASRARTSRRSCVATTASAPSRRGTSSRPAKLLPLSQGGARRGTDRSGCRRRGPGVPGRREPARGDEPSGPADPLVGLAGPGRVLRGVAGARQVAPGAPWSLGSIATDPPGAGTGSRRPPPPW
ncbi:hypothetical protein NKG05_27615 [Oerskovia sp. M15]